VGGLQIRIRKISSVGGSLLASKVSCSLVEGGR
jgi:hypothetical protein